MDHYGTIVWNCLYHHPLKQACEADVRQVIIRAANMNAYVIAHDADLYYHALMRCVDRHYSPIVNKTTDKFSCQSSCHLSALNSNRRFPSAFNYDRERPYESPSKQLVQRIKSLYGSIPVEN